MLILASESHSRRAMLTAAGVPHQAVPARIDEEAVTASLRAAGVSARDVADRLAELKAVKVSLAHPGQFVLGSDQMLEVEPGQWLEKPGSAEGLRTQLHQLRGRTHRLFCAAVIARDGVPLWRHLEAAKMTVRLFSDDWLDTYVAQVGSSVFNSVGGYHVEGPGVQLFDRIEGDQFVIRGLPLIAVLAWLRTAGVVGA